MPKEIIYFQEKKFSFKKNFFKLMNVLIANQSNSPIESIAITAINYIQLLSSFYSKQINVFNPDKYKSDYILYILESLVRIKDLFRKRYLSLGILNCTILAFIGVAIIFFILIINNGEKVYFKFKINIMNFIIKFFLFFLYIVSLDVSFSQMCIGKSQHNPNFDEEIECFGKNKYPIIIPTITIILSIGIHEVLMIYYFESLFISDFFFAKLNTYYDVYMDINYVINSILLNQAYFLSHKLFLFYNCIFSIFIFFYFVRNHIYYNVYINLTAGIFHSIYAWTSIFSIIIIFINFKEKGLIYIVSCIFVGFIYYNIKIKVKNNFIYDISINEIKNSSYLLAYIKELTDLLIKNNGKTENKNLITGLLNQLINESPNKICDDLIKEKMYIPLTNEWRDKKKDRVTDNVFIKYFIIILYNYFLVSNNNCPELYLNLSHYYLVIIGNYCEAMYYCQKLFELNLNIQQRFAFYRLKLEISKILTNKLIASDNKNVPLECINISAYYQYENLTENFIEQISNDIDLSLKFWKLFKEMHRNPEFKLNFNEIYDLSEKIQIKKNNIDKIWVNLLKEYSGINEYFELYNEYIIQINDDDIKKRQLEDFKKKAIIQDDDLNNNFYSILFDNDTGIIIVSKDKGTEGIIKHWNKTIEKLFKYYDQDLKDKNINVLMPKIFEKKHSLFMENYFKTGYGKYIETKDFKTFAKDKNNSIMQVRLALKLLPILNYNVIFVGLILKENLNDIILVDENFMIQGMCEKLKNNLNITNDFLFQANNIPFYIICKKFINFYKMFINNKRNGNDDNNKELLIKKTDATDKQNNINIVSSKVKGEIEEDLLKKEENQNDKQQVLENFEINENFELEFEIVFPQFLINYSNKVKLSKTKISENIKFKCEDSEDSEVDDLDDEDNELLSSNHSRKKNSKKVKSNNNTPTPFEKTQTFPLNLTLLNLPKDFTYEKVKLIRSEEEKIFYERTEKMCDLFKEEKFEELEDLIDTYNKDTSFTEYKFNFTFDKYKYGDNNIAFIIRCIDNKNTEGQNEEKSFDLDSNMIRYKKNKEQSIKPLYEITSDEREQTIRLPEKFFKLLDSKHFRLALEESKEEINKISKIKGNHDHHHILNHNVSSHSSGNFGFDNGLVIKNKIGELRSNLFQNMPNYFTIKYLRLLVISISLFTLIFSFILYIFLLSLFKTLNDVSLLNLNLYKASLKTIDLVSIIISLKALMLKKLGKCDFDYYDFIDRGTQTNDKYYKEMIRIGTSIYHELNNEYGLLNIYATKYISEPNMAKLYWDQINISYLNELYVRDNRKGKDSFPNAIDQFLYNTISFLKKYNYTKEDYILPEDTEDEEYYFNYITFLLIENSYMNIIPNLFNKLEKIPEVYTEYNNNKKIFIYLITFIYASCQIIIAILYIVLIHVTNISMSEIFINLTKIKYEKIEETIKKIEKFLSHLRNFREIIFTHPEDEDMLDNKDIKYRRRNNMIQRHSVHFNLSPQGEKIYLANNNGFNSDPNNYYRLTILRNYFVHSLILILTVFAFLIPIYLYSVENINVINQLMLIINYIYGKLMNTSLNILDLKCYIMECQLGNFSLSYEHMGSNANIQLFVKGIRNFEGIEDYYDNKFMLNACKAAINKEIKELRYNICMSDNVILTTNNTDNILELMKNYIDNLYRKDKMDKLILDKSKYLRKNMFSNVIFKDIEYLFFNYIYTVKDIFEETVIFSLKEYINHNKLFLVTLIFCFCALMITYNIIYLILFTPKLIYLINVSRGILKIIPTSVIMNTMELHNLIGTKYSKY